MAGERFQTLILQDTKAIHITITCRDFAARKSRNLLRLERLFLFKHSSEIKKEFYEWTLINLQILMKVEIECYEFASRILTSLNKKGQVNLRTLCCWRVDSLGYRRIGIRPADWYSFADTVDSRTNFALQSRSVIHRESKKQDNKLSPITSPNVNRFWQFFYWQTQWKFATNSYLNIPSHHNYVATLPCEISQCSRRIEANCYVRLSHSEAVLKYLSG